MHWGWQSWSIAGAIVVLLAVLHRTLTRKFRVWTGWADWCRTAATLSWLDRWQLHWANATGRAVSDRRLAPLAVQRGEAAAAMRRVGGPKSRRYWFGFAGLLLVLTASNIVLGEWISAGVTTLLSLYFAYFGVTEGAAKRSAEANRLLAEHD